MLLGFTLFYWARLLTSKGTVDAQQNLLYLSASLSTKKKNFLSAFSSLVGRDESRISHILFSDSELDTRKLDTNTNLGFPEYRHEMDTQRDRVGNG